MSIQAVYLRRLSLRLSSVRRALSALRSARAFRLSMIWMTVIAAPMASAMATAAQTVPVTCSIVSSDQWFELGLSIAAAMVAGPLLALIVFEFLVLPLVDKLSRRVRGGRP